MSDYPQGKAFLELLLAAMHDAALEGKLTQFRAQFMPEGESRMRTVRIIIVPEKFEHTWPSVAPAGTPTS